VQAEGYPTVRVFEQPEKDAAIIGEIPSESEAFIFINDAYFRKSYYRVKWGRLEGWIGCKNIKVEAGEVVQLKRVIAVQAEGYPTVRVFEQPEKDAAIIGEIPSESEAFIFINDAYFRKSYYRVKWGRLEGWVGRKNIKDMNENAYSNAHTDFAESSIEELPRTQAKAIPYKYAVKDSAQVLRSSVFWFGCCCPGNTILMAREDIHFRHPATRCGMSDLDISDAGTAYQPLASFVDQPPSELKSCKEHVLDMLPMLSGVQHMDSILQEAANTTATKADTEEAKLIGNMSMVFAIVLFTMDLSGVVPDPCDQESNFYYVFNQQLRRRKSEFMPPAQGYLYFLMTGLSRLPSARGYVFGGIVLRKPRQPEQSSNAAQGIIGPLSLAPLPAP